jgi:starch synthase
MEIVHVAAECYPVAKAGGLGDVVGSLPKYQQQQGHIAKVAMPMYRTPFLYHHTWQVVHKGSLYLGAAWLPYTIIKEENNILGFDLFLVDINGVLDREKIYGYADDAERFIAFQIAVVDWMFSWNHQPDVVHVHDYHAGLIPFMMQHCYAYQQKLQSIPTVLTIHNAEYQGWMNWNNIDLLPAWDKWKWGQLDWKNTINPLASAIKCAWKVTAVSPNYMQELKWASNGLEALFEYEKGKCLGIINGIDTAVWNPEKDDFLIHHFSTKNIEPGKQANKIALCKRFNLNETLPLIIFIGRLVKEKAADLLPQIIEDSLHNIGTALNFLVLGSGDPYVEHRLNNMKNDFVGFFNSQINYDEQLSHQMYAGADFLLMPSRVEPCGLNQLYAMRYGTIPIVRRTGGLKDTVKDIGEPNGFGICFDTDNVGDITHGVYRALQLYQQKETMKKIKQQIMQLNYSWGASADQYLHIYQSLKNEL